MGFIHNYYYKPDRPQFHGHWSRHLLLGVELEVDEGGEDEHHARQVLTILNVGVPESERNAYIKHDGSLSAGFEIVSQPATIQYHLRKIPWQKAFEYLLDAGYKSGSTATCGLHVHFNRIFFGDNEQDMLAGEARLLYFFESNWNKIVRFSRRNERQLRRWCKRYGHTRINDALADNDGDRYYAINFRNPTTDEIRIFKGTLKYETFVAALLFTDSLVRYCKKTKHITGDADSWETFLRFVKKFPRNSSQSPRSGAVFPTRDSSALVIVGEGTGRNPLEAGLSFRPTSFCSLKTE